MCVFGALCVYNIDLFYHSYPTVMPKDMHFLYQKMNKVLTTWLCTLQCLAVLNHIHACLSLKASSVLEQPFSECIQKCIQV